MGQATAVGSNGYVSADPVQFPDRRQLLKSKSRLTALLAALAVLGVAVFAAGCGGSSDDNGTSGGGRMAAANRSRSAPTSPIPPFEESARPRPNYTGFDIELMEAIAEKIGRTAEFQDTSFDTIFRDVAQGKFDAVDLGGDDHRRTRENGRLLQPVLPLRTGDPGQGRQRHQIGSKTWKGKTVGVQQGTTGRGTREGKDRRAAKSAPTRRAPTRSTRSKPARSKPSSSTRPVAENAVEADGGIEIAGRDPDRRRVWNRRRPGRNRTARRNQRRPERSRSTTATYETIYEKWFHKPNRRRRSTRRTARSGMSQPTAREGHDEPKGRHDGAPSFELATGRETRRRAMSEILPPVLRLPHHGRTLRRSPRGFWMTS